MRLYDYLLEAAREEPQKIALEFQDKKIPFGYLADESRKLAAGLRDVGLQTGQSVGAILPNIPNFVAAQFGTNMAGGTFVPMNVMLRAPEIRYVVEDSDLRVLIVYEMFLPAVVEAIDGLKNPPVLFVLGSELGGHRPYAELLKDDPDFKPIEYDPDQPAQTLYTSGTTGKPKGAQITGANVVANLNMVEKIFPVYPEDKTLCVLPLFHVFALNGVLNSAIRHRTTIVLHTKFELEPCVKSLVEDDITTFAGVPTMYFYILKHPKIQELKFPKLRHCVVGGAPMPLEVITEFEKITGVTVYEGFGLTETTVSVCINRPDRRKIGSIGIPYDEVDMKVVDDDDNELPPGKMGEIIVRAPNVMLGYLNKPEATAEAMRNGYFHTGDIGHRDEEGFFYIVDRKKDMIIKGGFNIYPREIEEIIYQLRQVAEAAVIGTFDEAKGEQIVACIAFKPDQSLTEEEVHAHLEKNLAKYKLPQEYVITSELPKGPTGKILKRELRAQWHQWSAERVNKGETSEPAVGT